MATGTCALIVINNTLITIITQLRVILVIQQLLMGEKRNAYSILLGKPEGKTPLGRPRHRWENIRMDLREIGWGGVDWIDLAQDRD
jgi:hypothetical protein